VPSRIALAAIVLGGCAGLVLAATCGQCPPDTPEDGRRWPSASIGADMITPSARFDDLVAGTALRCPPPDRLLVATRADDVA
jgi:hypothetical protein